MITSGSQKKITIISFSTYPRNSPRALRTHELAREFARQGHIVNLYVLKGNYNYAGYEKSTGVNVRSLGKTRFFKFSPELGMTQNFMSKVVKKLFGRWLEYPNIELMLKAYSAIKKEKESDLLITIAIPYPLHWGAALDRTVRGSSLDGPLWVADCGDPYMGNPFIKKPFYFKYVEKWFCRKADFISIPIEEARRAYYPEFYDKIRVIPQGFKLDNMSRGGVEYLNDIPVFLYAGAFYENLRDPRPFLDYLATINKDFRFVVFTKSKSILKGYQDLLGKKIEIHDFIPRSELLLELHKADFLINFENESKVQAPSKLIDYAISDRPVLTWDNNSKESKEIFNEFLSGNYKRKQRMPNVDKYRIENVTKGFLSLLNSGLDN